MIWHKARFDDEFSKVLVPDSLRDEKGIVLIFGSSPTPVREAVDVRGIGAQLCSSSEVIGLSGICFIEMTLLKLTPSL